MRDLRGRGPVLAFALLAAVAAIAPWLAPYKAGRQFAGYPFAPPMRPHVVDAEGRWHWRPFAYPIRIVDPIERRYAEDRTRRLTLASAADPADTAEPWFLLGSDGIGRDVLSRVLEGARLSLGVALLSTVFALVIGAAVGASAGYAGGWADAVLMRVADFVIVLPGIYVVLALRGALPLVLTPAQVFVALVAVLSLVGWPSVARGDTRNRPRRTGVGVRRSCARARRRIVARDRASSAAGDARVPRRPGDRARAGLHHGGGDVILCRTRVCGAHAELGRDADGRRRRARRGRRAVAPDARNSDISNDLGDSLGSIDPGPASLGSQSWLTGYNSVRYRGLKHVFQTSTRVP